MRPSESPEMQQWARSRVGRYVREFPEHKLDFEQEALLSLVRAEREANCPSDHESDEFRAFVGNYIELDLRYYARKLRKHAHAITELELVDDVEWVAAVAAEPAPARCEWLEFRQLAASRLKRNRRLVFLETYGEDQYRRLADVAENTGLSLDYVKHQHALALETIRELSHFQRVA